MKKQIICLIVYLAAITVHGQVSVDVNLNVMHTVDGINTFDRTKFITIHANQTETGWDGTNFTSDLRADFLTGYDVYLGRDTGGITWNLNNMPEDPARPGFADPASITTKGTNSRNNYASKAIWQQYEDRKVHHVVGAQLHPFWTGESQKATNTTGWKLANATATGEYMGRYFNAFHGGNGQPEPTWVEVINEPAYEALGGKYNYTNSLQEIADFHVEVADAIRVQNPNLKIGGYTVAFPDFETGDFQRWINRDKLFVDVAGDKMDFWSWHLYDFPAFNGKVDLRSGSNLEATFDMMDHYSILKLGDTKPYVISEYGAQTHDYNNEQWSPYRDWLFLKSQNSQLMSFMERPNTIAVALPFTIVKAEWGYNSDTGIPYRARLMRKANEPNSYTGEWVYTERVKFYQLWKNVKGARVDTKATDLDIQVDAYVDGDKGYVILNNLEFNEVNINLNVFDNAYTNITSVVKRHLTLKDNVPALEEETITHAISSVVLGAESTLILEYNFAEAITIDETSEEVKYYADTYLKPIVANQEVTFAVNGVVKNQSNGEAVLRLGIGRDHGSNLIPIVKVNNQSVVVPEDWRGYDQADKGRFFGTLEIPVPFDVLTQDNSVSVTFPDSGGHISSMALQVFNFSSDVRAFTPDKLPINNFTIKKTDAICLGEYNGTLTINTVITQNYAVAVVGDGYNESFNFTDNLSITNLKPGTYEVTITMPEFTEYKTTYSVRISEPEALSVSSKVAKHNLAVVLKLNGADTFFVKHNESEIKTNNNEIELVLAEGENNIKVTTDKNCQGIYQESIYINKSHTLFPNPVAEALSIVVSQKLQNSVAFIYNVSGVLVTQKQISLGENIMPVNGLQKGMYIVIFMRESEKIGTSKFLVN